MKNEWFFENHPESGCGTCSKKLVLLSPQTLFTNKMKPTDNQIVRRLKVVRSFQPGARGSSFIMTIVQFLSFIGGLILFGVSGIRFLTKKEEYTSCNCEKTEAYLILVIAIILMLVWKLTRMVRRRNAYILLVKKAMDSKLEPEEIQVNNGKEQSAKNNAENTNREESGLKQI